MAVGGGHGLAATLRALRRVTDELTAVVGVSDDGGSSGRLRRELGVPPPGDLRMALAALCGDDAWGRTWSRVVQHRFGGNGDLAGHALGNLLITALWEETADIVVGLDWVAALLGAHGRVLPVATQGLQIVAEVTGLDPTRPDLVQEVRGQAAVAGSSGRVASIRLEPAHVAACPQALEAIAAADVVVLGPGSWFTSVLAPLLVPGMSDAVGSGRRRVVLVCNVGNQDLETSGLSRAQQLQVLAEHVPAVGIDMVVADPQVHDRAGLEAVAVALGAKVTTVPVAARDGSPTHDVDLLASALAGVLA
ncbi:MAG: uridine diphosphate-N-acetylglucosamine-binding protein YvcK [Candidatus Nanopelagicales bacterium]